MSDLFEDDGSRVNYRELYEQRPDPDNQLWKAIKDVAERGINSCYGTDPRHALLAKAIADEVALGKKMPLNLSRHFGRLRPRNNDGDPILPRTY